MYDNILPVHSGHRGEPDAERGLDGIEKSYARIAEECAQPIYAGLHTHQPVIDGKFRKIEVRSNEPAWRLSPSRLLPLGRGYA